MLFFKFFYFCTSHLKDIMSVNFRILHSSQYRPITWAKVNFLTNFQKQHSYNVHLDPYLSEKDEDLHYRA